MATQHRPGRGGELDGDAATDKHCHATMQWRACRRGVWRWWRGQERQICPRWHDQLHIRTYTQPIFVMTYLGRYQYCYGNGYMYLYTVLYVQYVRVYCTICTLCTCILYYMYSMYLCTVLYVPVYCTICTVCACIL